jgi:hypothetical protein
VLLKGVPASCGLVLCTVGRRVNSLKIMRMVFAYIFRIINVNDRKFIAIITLNVGNPDPTTAISRTRVEAFSAAANHVFFFATVTADFFLVFFNP